MINWIRSLFNSDKPKFRLVEPPFEIKCDAGGFILCTGVLTKELRKRLDAAWAAGWRPSPDKWERLPS